MVLSNKCYFFMSIAAIWLYATCLATAAEPPAKRVLSVKVKQTEKPAEKPPAVSLAKGRYVRISLLGLDHVLSLAEVEVIETGSGAHLERGATAEQSTTAADGAAARAIDGNTNGDFYAAHSVTNTDVEQDPYWEVDLGSVKDIGVVRIHNRSDCCGQRLSGAIVEILDADRGTKWLTNLGPTHDGQVITLAVPQKTLTRGRYVRVSIAGLDHILSLAEVQVLETGSGKQLQKDCPTTQTTASGGGEGSRAADGNTNQNFYNGSVTHTEFKSDPAWEVDLGAVRDIGQIKVYNRGDCCGGRLSGAKIEVLDDKYKPVWSAPIGPVRDGSVHDFTAGE
ncbi:MAG: discoidin domain-containing protein [Planctomycetia bacterium]|nr:discoidin domain-containing protein [Planctomycetia bacterium]